MPNLNKVFLMGNLTKDCDLAYTANGTAICKLGLAVNRRWTQDGQQKEDVTFIDCTAWGKTGEALAKYLKKGRPVFIEGRLKLEQWETKEGAKRSKLGVVVEGFQFIDGKPAGGADPVGTTASPRRPVAAQPAPEDQDTSQPPPIAEADIPF
jgi:single-strand DNA-binding protein